MWIRIDTECSLSLTRQIYNQIKQMILEGGFTPGEKLPSTRELARELNISRNTIIEVYDQLISEGYLEGHHGSGTVVTNCIPKGIHLDKKTDVPRLKTGEEHFIDFRSGVPDLELFPRKEMGKLYNNVCNDLSNEALRYSGPAGVFELRDAISQYLYRIRGINCNPHNIMIISGSTQGLSLISELLHVDNKKVFVEDPIHPGLLNVMASNGCNMIGIPADEKGLNSDLLPPQEQVSFIYTTPSHQYPLGGILPLQRRVALIQYALDHECYIIEDDYDSEFRFEGQPINSLYELSPQSVIYLGSFSKILAPAIRLGFILLPEDLIEKYKQLKQYTDVHTEAISQYVLAQFIKDGGLERHIWKTKKLYHKKRDHLLKELSDNFTGEYDIRGQAAGLHVVVHFHEVTFTPQLMEQLSSTHIKIYRVAEYCINHRDEYLNDIILGYAHLSFSDISRGIKILCNIIDQNRL